MSEHGNWPDLHPAMPYGWRPDDPTTPDPSVPAPEAGREGLHHHTACPYPGCDYQPANWEDRRERSRVEAVAVHSGTHEPAVDDFGNQYLAVTGPMKKWPEGLRDLEPIRNETASGFARRQELLATARERAALWSLHQQEHDQENDETWCSSCGVRWPCPTIEVLQRAAPPLESPTPECLCEGEFIWACGPECGCYHHAEAQP